MGDNYMDIARAIEMQARRPKDRSPERTTIIQSDEITDLKIDMETLSGEEFMLKYFCI